MKAGKGKSLQNEKKQVSEQIFTLVVLLWSSVKNMLEVAFRYKFKLPSRIICELTWGSYYLPLSCRHFLASIYLRFQIK